MIDKKDQPEKAAEQKRIESPDSFNKIRAAKAKQKTSVRKNEIGKDSRDFGES